MNSRFYILATLRKCYQAGLEKTMTGTYFAFNSLFIKGFNLDRKRDQKRNEEGSIKAGLLFQNPLRQKRAG